MIDAPFTAHPQDPADYPYLEREDVLQALRYAAWQAEEREVNLAGAGALLTLYPNRPRLRLLPLLRVD